MKRRVDLLRDRLCQKEIDGLLVMKPENRKYLSGFSGTAGSLVVTREQLFLLTDFRYIEQAEHECKQWQVMEIKTSTFDLIKTSLQDWKISRLGYEEDFLTHKQFLELSEKVHDGILVPAAGMVENLRIIKSQDEIAQMINSARMADEAFAHILSFLKPGCTEVEISLEMEYFMRRGGAKKISFDTIVASGVRGAMPHGVASDKQLEIGDLVTMDFGCEFNNYCSDITRTVCLGAPTEMQERIYRIVLEAHDAGVHSIRQGVKASDVDLAARNVIEKYHFGKNFRHSTGHGVGLIVHENPVISAKDGTILQAGMVITVEPGVYLPGWGGVRIEDMVLVEEKGARLLTNAPRDHLIVL
ncbi:MAG TPA: Xaa-Pro dipeptidase [Desulfotomaculum sp.]|nr:Xaa-Pro dipeptidase [Desulfotomaculum sp.]